MLQTASCPPDLQFAVRIVEQPLHYPHTFVFLRRAQEVSIDEHVGLIVAQNQSCQRVFVNALHVLAELGLPQVIIIQAVWLRGWCYWLAVPPSLVEFHWVPSIIRLLVALEECLSCMLLQLGQVRELLRVPCPLSRFWHLCMEQYLCFGLSLVTELLSQLVNMLYLLKRRLWVKIFDCVPPPPQLEIRRLWPLLNEFQPWLDLVRKLVDALTLLQKSERHGGLAVPRMTLDVRSGCRRVVLRGGSWFVEQVWVVKHGLVAPVLCNYIILVVHTLIMNLH